MLRALKVKRQQQKETHTFGRNQLTKPRNQWWAFSYLWWWWRKHFVPAKYKCVIAAFHGRSGSIMNAIGATYVNAHMLRAEVIDLHFDESKMTVIPGTQYVTKHVCS